MRTRIALIVIASALGLTLLGCDEKTQQQWGEVGDEADEAVESTGRRVEPALEEAGGEIGQQLDELGDGVRSVGERIERRVEIERAEEAAEESAEDKR